MVNTLTAALIAANIVAASAVSAGTSELKWQADYGKALSATRRNDLPLLVVLDVPDNPKESVETEQLEPEGEQAELLAKYQLCHVDVSTSYGKKVANAFEAKKFPFTAIIDKTGSVVLLTKSGQVSRNEWIKTLARYKAGDSARTMHTSFYRGSASAETSLGDSSDCPACRQRAAQTQ